MKQGISKGDSILIIGGSGFIGRHLALRCLKLTPSVTTLDLPEDAGGLDGVEALRADIRSDKEVKEVLSGKRFNYVFNLGGYIDHAPYFAGGRRAIETHLVGLMNIIDHLDRSQLRGFVQIGSSDEYGDALAPQKETMPESPISPYSFAKVSAAHLIRMLSSAEGFPGVVLRFFLVYGPGQDRERFLPQIIDSCLRNDNFNTSEGIQIRDFCYVDDVVDAMVKAASSESAVGQVINIGSGRPVSIRDVISKIMAITGGGRPIWGAHPYRNGENMRLYADITLARSLLGWEPKVALDEGLRVTVDHFRAGISGR